MPRLRRKHARADLIAAIDRALDKHGVDAPTPTLIVAIAVDVLRSPVTVVKPHDERCDCKNPDCGLPVGRCYLCGNPYPHCSGTDGLEFTVCPKCAPAVRALYKQECATLLVLKRAGFEDRGEEGAAWSPFDEDDAGAFCIQRDDCQDHFENDDEAAHYVAGRLGIKPTYPEGA